TACSSRNSITSTSGASSSSPTWYRSSSSRCCSNNPRHSTSESANRRPHACQKARQEDAAAPRPHSRRRQACARPAGAARLDPFRSGPRGGSTTIRGPFAVFLHAPAFGELAQQLGGHCRFKTAVAPRLSEFAILATAKLWRAQYEWFAHVPMAERAGVKTET